MGEIQTRIGWVCHGEVKETIIGVGNDIFTWTKGTVGIGVPRASRPWGTSVSRMLVSPAAIRTGGAVRG